MASEPMPSCSDSSDEYASLQTSTSLESQGQVLVTLSTNNIRKLLSEAASTLLQSDRQSSTSALLSRLTELSPGVAKHFHLKQQDPVDGIPLRMVCSSQLTCVPSFVAVSYCWHYPTWSPSPHAQPISPGWGISKPMVRAIMQLRQSEEEGVWVDRLCINQADQSEKVSHVGAMNIIYRSARRILILLEDVQLTAAEVEAGLAYAGFFADMCRVVERERLQGTAKAEFVNSYFPQQEDLLRQRNGGHHLSSIKSFAMKMLGGRWYSRAWCAHESRTARHGKVNNPLLLCYGHNGAVLSFEFRFIYYLSCYLCGSEPPEPVSGAALKVAMRDPNPATLRHLWWRMIRLMPDAVSSSSPIQHLVSILSFDCQFKGDLVSIALNTWELPLLYDGVISTVEDAIATFSLLTIASGDLTPLVTSGSKLQVHGGLGTGSEMVSWLVRPTQGVLGGPLTVLVPESITSVTQDYIDLDLLVFASLPQNATSDSLHRAAMIVQTHGLLDLRQDILAAADAATISTMQSLKGEMDKTSHTRQTLLSTFHELWLALALDCGLDWILDFAAVMQKETSEEDWAYGSMGVSADSRLTDAAYSVLALFGVTRDDASLRGPRYLDKVVRFMTCLLDPRLIFFTTSPRRLRVGPGAADFAIMPAVSNRSWVAVPAAVAHLPSWYERAWIIEPVQPAGTVQAGSPLLTSDFADSRVRRGRWGTSWHLKTRERVYGCDLLPQRLLAGGQHNTFLLKRQRVYGADNYDWGSAAANAGENEA